MKNVNIKKVVAGAAALAIAAGSLGAVVSAANVADSSYTTPNGLARADMFNAQGAPSYNIVVGSTGHASDVVWAANIAAAIGKKAYNVSTASATGGDVVVEVGAEGITTVSGNGYLSDRDLTINTASGTKVPLTLGNSDYAVLYDDDVSGNIKGNSSFEIRQTEELTINADTFFSTQPKVKDIMTFIQRADIDYTLTFGGDGLPVGANLDETFETGDTMPIKFMGGTYELQSVSTGATPKMTLVGSGSKSVKRTGDLISTGSYTLEVGAVTSNDRVMISLKEGSSELATGLFRVNDEVKFTGYTLTDKIKVVSVDQIDNQPDFVELSIGSEGLLELENDKVLPGYGSSSDIQWKVQIAFTDVNKTHIDYVRVFNDKQVWNVEDKTHSRSGALAEENILLPLGLGAINFLGLTNENTYEFKIGDNLISWADNRGRVFEIPLYETAIAGVQKFGYHDYYFEDSNTDGLGLRVYEGTSNTGTELDNSPFLDGAVIGLKLHKDLSNLIGDFNYTVVQNGSTYDLAIMVQDEDIPIGKTGKHTWNFVGSEFDGNATYDDEDYFAYREVNSSGKGAAKFKLVEDTENLDFYIDLRTMDLVRKSDFTGSSGETESYVTQVDYESDTWVLDQDHSDDLRFAYTPYGSYVEVSGSMATMEIPEFARYLKVFVGGEMTSSTTSLGSEVTLTTPGEVVDADGIKVKLVSAPEGSATTYTPAAFGNIAYLDTDTLPAGNKIIVGGWMVNEEAKTLGLEDLVTKAGDFVAGKNAQGNIVVAGFHKEDTANAAKELIAAIEAMN